MFKDDLTRLRHMLDAAREIVSFTDGKKREDLKENRMLVLSLIKEVEIIGEAASKISNETKAKYPDIPWPVIIQMRNRLIHVYYDVDQNVVWETSIKDIPPLIAALKKVVDEEAK